MPTSVIDRLSAAVADRYSIERELGAGGMATVYLAHDIRHDRDVAIKVLHPDLGAALGADRFLTEIRTTARLQHPHILPLLDSGSADGLLYYVMPYVAGETLRARLERERQLPVGDAVLIAREVADALGSAHALGIIHRDIKPENILLQGGHALVADFGIALAVQTAGGQRMTQTGLSLGTPQYMSPEQAMGERVIDARSDLYALGAVTYEMLVGEAPFTGPSVQAIVARVMTEEPRSIVVQRRAVPSNVEAAVMRALEKLPADRFATAAQFGEALTTPGFVTGRAPSAIATRARRPGRAVVLVSAVAVLATVAAIAGWLRPRPAAAVVRYSIMLDSIPTKYDARGEIAISPDGSLIVHDGPFGGKLFLHRRNALELTPIPATDGASVPGFSPDGTKLAFMVNLKLMVMPVAGGQAVQYADSLGGVQTPRWAADGRIYGLRHGAGVANGAIWRMEAKAGAPLERVTTVDTAAGEDSHYFPELLPDQRFLIFTIDYAATKLAIGLADLRSGKHSVLIPGAVRARYLRGRMIYTTPDGTLWTVPFDATAHKVTGEATMVAQQLQAGIFGPVDFAVSDNGTLAYGVDDANEQRRLGWVGRDGTSVAIDSAWLAPFSGPRLSPDGRTVAVSLRDANTDGIWLRPLGEGQRTRLTLETEVASGPAWTPDGVSVSYLTGNKTSLGVWMKRADGSEAAERILQYPRSISEVTWSPAGAWLVIRTTTATAGAGDILGMRVPADSVPVPIMTTPNSEYSPSISPDGKWMAYTEIAAGKPEIVVVPFPVPGTARWQVSIAGGVTPLWSRRGGEIFYLDTRGRLVSAEVTTTPTFAVKRVTPLFDASNFAIIGPSRRNYDVAPDDQHFLMVRRAAGSSGARMVVVENWFEEWGRK